MKTVCFTILLWSVHSGIRAQSLDLSKTVINFTTGGNGTLASQGDVLLYTIFVKNLSAQNFAGARLYDNIPAGVSYVTGSTTLNGVSVADVSSKMPYANTGGLINASLYGAGILAPNATGLPSG